MKILKFIGSYNTNIKLSLLNVKKTFLLVSRTCFNKKNYKFKLLLFKCKIYQLKKK